MVIICRWVTSQSVTRGCSNRPPSPLVLAPPALWPRHTSGSVPALLPCAWQGQFMPVTEVSAVASQSPTGPLWLW